MFDLTFSLLDDGLPQKGRVIVLFRFITAGKMVRSGMLNFDRSERRFLGPQRNPQLMDAALEFIEGVESGRAGAAEKSA